MMSAVRARENKAEVALRRALWRRGYRYRLQVKTLVGKPDIVLARHRVAIFVDSDYWHGRALLEGGEKALRQVIRGERFLWWRDKMLRNIARDAHVTRELKRLGWRVIRVWESDLLRDLDRTAARLSRRIGK